MTTFKVQYRGVSIPESILTPGLFGAGILDAFKKGVDGVLDQDVQAEPEYEYFTDGDADPYTYYRRFKPGQEYGDFLGGRGGLWYEDQDTSREDMTDDYGYDPVSFEDMPEWARVAATRE